MTRRDEASALRVHGEAAGTRVEVRSGIGFVVADAVEVQSVSEGAGDFHAALRCASWPVALRLYRGTLPTRATRSLATTLCTSFVERRAKGAAEVEEATAAQLESWGAEHAAFALYALNAEEDGFDHEECLYLLKGTVGWRVVKRFDSRCITPVAWNEFGTSLDATLGWAGARAGGPPVASAFVDGQMRLSAATVASAGALARWLSASGVGLAEVVDVTEALRAFVYGRDPPDARVELASLDAVQRALARVPSPALRAALEATMGSRVATWRDLRGLQCCLEEVARQLGAHAPRAVACDCGAVLHPVRGAPSEAAPMPLDAYRADCHALEALSRDTQRWMHPSRQPRRLLLLRSALDPLQKTVAQHLAQCPVERGTVAEPFGLRKRGVGARRSAAAPPEIAGISRGGYTESIGLHVNEGYASWCGFDLDRGVVVKVVSFSGACLAQAPRVSAATPTSYARETQGERGPVRAVVSYRALAGEGLARVVALANVLWETEPLALSHATDVYHRVELLDGSEGKSMGGCGVLQGPAGRLARLLNSLLA